MLKKNKPSAVPAPVIEDPAEIPAEPIADAPSDEPAAEPIADAPKSDLPDGYETSEAARLRLLREKAERNSV